MSFLILIVALYAAAALDATVLARTHLGGATPQLVLLAGLAWVCVYRGPRAYVGAALAGLTADLTGTGRMGICFALLTSLALTADLLGRWLPLDRPFTQAALVAIGTAAIVLVVSCIGAMPAMADVPWPSLLGWATLSGVYTGVVGWPILMIVRRRRHALS